MPDHSSTTEHPSTAALVADWFNARLSDQWFARPVRAMVDKDEILLVGELEVGEGASPAEREEAVAAFRAETKAARIAVASEAENTWQRKVSWAVECGDHQYRFTSVSAPVMTRLRIDERAVLDTLIDAGVARSRSEALAWCVRLVGQHESDWIGRLRQAVQGVEQIRAEGPSV